MIILGLTGSIGMGKTTASNMFAEAGVPVYSADDAVHRLYSGRAAPLIEAAFPGTVANGTVDREKLSAEVIGKPDALKKLESIVHPLVREEEEAFLREAEAQGSAIALVDIPLLFETGGEKRVDRIVVVSAPADIQRARVLARPGMTAEKLDAILARQTPDAEKRARADFVLDTSGSFDNLRQQITAVIQKLSGKPAVATE
ncbi:dephospho-CoA kinase [Brucella haematophila]|uniref:Dephospho-CoA kinase n=1 Tax=Brucella haematophila TaxID=419474 RepID=A0ABX1DPE2_9HYPH|nr:dephospho-CoA kinase [Brucella haematophila]KAB2700767.1 dephospho-CoA kinase [Ochrobactrum sp. Kaboul]NKC03513.1 dephospho-CoA kinase [Brucella haematophila]TMV05306.1 dephospho-CoA kinase [Brucella haematophila]